MPKKEIMLHGVTTLHKKLTLWTHVGAHPRPHFEPYSFINTNHLYLRHCVTLSKPRARVGEHCSKCSSTQAFWPADVFVINWQEVLHCLREATHTHTAIVCSRVINPFCLHTHQLIGGVYLCHFTFVILSFSFCLCHFVCHFVFEFCLSFYLFHFVFVMLSL